MVSTVFLDRDGVVLKEKNHLHSMKEVELEDGAAKGISLLKQNKWKVVIVTNQPVIAMGLCTEQELELIHQKMKSLLLETESTASIDAVYYCPHHPTKAVIERLGGDCECRKPKPGMILQASRDLRIGDLSTCYMVGDKMSDITAGESAGCKTILVETGYGGRGSFNNATPTFMAKNLKEAAEKIIFGK